MSFHLHGRDSICCHLLCCLESVSLLLFFSAFSPPLPLKAVLCLSLPLVLSLIPSPSLFRISGSKKWTAYNHQLLFSLPAQLVPSSVPLLPALPALSSPPLHTWFFFSPSPLLHLPLHFLFPRHPSSESAGCRHKWFLWFSSGSAVGGCACECPRGGESECLVLSCLPASSCVSVWESVCAWARVTERAGEKERERELTEAALAVCCLCVCDETQRHAELSTLARVCVSLSLSLSLCACVCVCVCARIASAWLGSGRLARESERERENNMSGVGQC